MLQVGLKQTGLSLNFIDTVIVISKKMKVMARFILAQRVYIGPYHNYNHYSRQKKYRDNRTILENPEHIDNKIK